VSRNVSKTMSFVQRMLFAKMMPFVKPMLSTKNHMFLQMLPFLQTDEIYTNCIVCTHG
jgi:hypothetical protein